MNDRQSLGLWKNDNRTNPRQPPLKGGKPVNIEGQDFWVAAYINTPRGDDKLTERVEAMINHLADVLGKSPVISVSLTPAEGRGMTADKADEMNRSMQDNGDQLKYNDDIPF